MSDDESERPGGRTYARLRIVDKVHSSLVRGDYGCSGEGEGAYVANPALVVREQAVEPRSQVRPQRVTLEEQADELLPKSSARQERMR